MREAVRLTGFILVAIGLVGLLITDFVFDEATIGWLDLTLVFAAIDALGLAILAVAFWGMKQESHQE